MEIFLVVVFIYVMFGSIAVARSEDIFVGVPYFILAIVIYILYVIGGYLV